MTFTVHTFRCDERLWSWAGKVAKRLKRTRSFVIREAMRTLAGNELPPTYQPHPEHEQDDEQ